MSEKKPWTVKRGVRLFLLAVGAMVILALVFAEKEPKQTTGGPSVAASAGNATPAAPTVPVVPIPELQQQFVAAVEAARQAYAAGANDMAKGAARPARAKALCDILKSKSAKNWVGKITTLSTNSDGLGVLEVEIGPKVTVQTWNNSLSDVVHKTLIPADSPVFKTASSLAKGRQVIFSGTFFSSTTDCITEGSLTLSGSIRDPAFIIRFTDLRTAQ